MQRRHAFVLFLLAGVGGLPSVQAQPKQPPGYEVYAVRYARLRGFPVAALVQGADRGRKLDIAMTVWVLKGPGRENGPGRRGFLSAAVRSRGKDVADYTRPDKALERLGIRPEQVTDIVVTHMHWDHADGVDLFPKAQVWIQKDEFDLLHPRGPAARRQ